VVLGGDIGFGEAYMGGLFVTDDLASLLGVLIRAFSGGRRPRRMSAFLSGSLARLVRAGEANSLWGSPRNIRRHYDLSNDFFRLFLDTSMTYSAALFRSPDEPLEQAQENKLRAILRKAGIRSGHHVLEIGSGWGSFAVMAVRETGCRVTTLTLSLEQYAHVTDLVRGLGLDDRITVLLRDYRQVTGSFDRIVSIEMMEAVGHRYLGAFFQACHRCLRPGGRVVIQVITIPDQEYAAYRLRLDWIQKHIFPGGHLPSLTALCRAMTRTTPFIVDHLENIGPHYAITLQRWHERFRARLDQVRALGYDEVFLLKWEYYLKSCEAMFRTRGLDGWEGPSWSGETGA
jgi:cyclopropane-fatty-acyl-phospholipid synthase